MPRRYSRVAWPLRVTLSPEVSTFGVFDVGDLAFPQGVLIMDANRGGVDCADASPALVAVTTTSFLVASNLAVMSIQNQQGLEQQPVNADCRHEYT